MRIRFELVRSRHLCLAAFLLVFTVLCIGGGSVAVAAEPMPTWTIDELRARFGEHCFDCHGDGADEGGLSFDVLAEGGYGDATLERWEAIWRNLRAETMPPPDAAHPEPSARSEWAAWIQANVFRLSPSQIDPGRVVVRRLNRSEYRETIQQLVGIDFDVREEFPADDTGYGFDTIGEVLMVSPVLLEKYLAAANTIMDRAIPGDGPAPPERLIGTDQWKLDKVGGESGRAVSFEKRVTFHYKNKVDHAGPYKMRLEWALDNAWTQTPTAGKLEFHWIDAEGKKQHTKSADLGFVHGTEGELEIDVQVPAGEIEFQADFTPTNNDAKAAQADQGEVPYKFRIRRSVLVGPRDGSRDQYRDPARRTLFNGPPPADNEAKITHAREVIKRFADRAFRRPIDDATLDRLCDVVRFTMEDPNKGYENGVSQALRRVLISPRFIYRIEQPATNPADAMSVVTKRSQLTPMPGTTPIDEHSLATRLSYFLWGGPPDDRLLTLASEGKLYASLDAEIDRMLGEEWRLRRGVSNFVGQWLQTRDVHNIEFDVDRVVGDRDRAKELNFGWEIRQAMIDETETMFRYLMQDNRPVHELLNARYTFLNEKLAKFYGIEGVKGGQMQRVELDDASRRRGILTHGSVLLVTSNPTRTSPVKRGLFVLENLLGSPAPPAPPNVPALEEAKKGDLSDASLRKILEQHRSDPACASCHQRMDPLGLALEHYNAIGQWRSEEPGEWNRERREQQPAKPIDAAGVLLTGESFTSLEELADILANQRRDDFYRCLTEKMMTFALGRGMTYHDSLVIDDIVRQLHEDDGRMRTLVKAIVMSIPFTYMRIDNTALAQVSP